MCQFLASFSGVTNPFLFGPVEMELNDLTSSFSSEGPAKLSHVKWINGSLFQLSLDLTDGPQLAHWLG